METSSAADVESKPTVSEIEAGPEKMEDMHEDGDSFTCDLCDKELTYKIAQDLLSGLATACVDGTTGVFFMTPASVAAEYRKDLIDYLIVRSESFVAETVVLDADHHGLEVSDHPLDILSNMIDDYAVSRKSLFSRVSGMMMNEMREDRIDDFVQEMERDSFWLLDRREIAAQAFIKNVDFKNLYHCNMKFGSEEEVIGHQETCGYRAVMCENEGCNGMFSADSVEHHDSICPFKILPCEQNCSELLMRRDMDKHCITDCPMKLTNCPFYSIGCQAPVPHSLIKKHCSESIHAHLLIVLRYIHKEAFAEDVERWADQVEKVKDENIEDKVKDNSLGVYQKQEKFLSEINTTRQTNPKSLMKNRLEAYIPACPPLEQETAQDSSTSATDEVASPPSKERDVVLSLTPEQEEKKTTPIEQDVVTPDNNPTASLPEESASSPLQQDIEIG
ncbi:uncharacterized protein [Phyllobates terribilis]|uniref:uncharacterized protein n=1 Tax=Phyllobates terribilis TaxID=111132 RepID=UPI003CCB1C1F